MKTQLRAIFAIWLRHVLVFRQLLFSSLATTILNPWIYLFCFGFGLGSVIDSMGGTSYLAFVSAGLLANSIIFTAGFETGINAYARFRTQRIYDAILATPANLLAVTGAELLWATTKGMMSATGVFLVAALYGGLPAGVAALWAVPVLLLGGMCFAACGLFATSRAKGFDFFNFYFTLWITPNFLFTGVFFTVDRYPEWIQLLATVLPMTHLVNAVRPLTTGTPIDLAFWGHLAYIAALSIAAFIFAHRKLAARLLD